MKTLIRYFLNRTLLVNLLTALILIFGYFSLTSINRESLPHVDNKKLIISTVYSGASPIDVESGVTIPIEDILKSIDGIKEYISQSVENYSRITVILEDDVKDSENVKNDIRREINNVDLPKEVTKRPYINEWSPASFPVMDIGIFSKKLPYKELRIRAKDLKKKLLECSYISKVEEKGILDREVKIKLNLEKLQENYISIQEVINTIKMHNIEMTGGTFKQDNKDKIITVFSKIETLDDVKNIIIRSTFEGNKIFLKDIADIKDDFQKESTRMRFNSRPGISLEPKKKESADIIDSTDEIKKIVKEYKESLKNEDIDFIYLRDESYETRTRLSIVGINALIGFILVVIILFLFMNFKNAFWTAAGIPLSVAFALIFYIIFDITINRVSLLGIIVVMGMVVDDAIIISENIFRHHLLGKSWPRAAREATIEVANPVISTVITTIVAFMILYFMKGVVGKFAKEIPLVITLILCGSLFEALLILPNHIAHNLGIKVKKVKVKEKRVILFLQKKYKIFLKKILNKKIIVLAVFLLLLGLSFYALFSNTVIKYDEFPSEETIAVFISGKVRSGQTLDFTEKKIKLIERSLEKYSRDVVSSFSSYIGEAGYPEDFLIIINLTPPSEREITGNLIISNTRKIMDQSGFFTNYYFKKESGGPPVGRAIQVHIRGNQNKKRRMISDKIFTYLEKIEGVRDIVRSDEESKEELKILVDHSKAARSGVSPYSIGETVRAAFNGVIVTDVKNPDETISYRVMLQDKFKNNMDSFLNLKVLNNQKRLVPLSGLIKYKQQKLTSRINHYNGDRTTIIEAGLNKKIITPDEIYKKIKKKFSSFERDYPGFSMTIGGEAKRSQESKANLIKSGMIALAMIFFILILLFRSLGQAFIVLLAVPFSFFGAAVVLLSHGMCLSYMALFGLVGLAGVVVNGSLVMVNYINRLKEKYKKNKNMDINSIIVEGAVTRLRPILLTTITTISGLLPTAYAIGGRDAFVIPTVRVIAWGLLFSTTLTLILIPHLYLSHYTINRYIKSMFKKVKFSFVKSGLIILLIFIFSSNLFSKNETIIQLDDFIKDCRKNNPKIFIELSKIKNSEAMEIESKAIHDIVFNLYYNRIYDEPFSLNPTFQIDNTKTDNIGGKISWIAPYLGTRLEGRIEYNKSIASVPPTVTNPIPGVVDFYNPSYSFNLSQPLLKNWFGILDDFPVKQAEFNKLITKETVNEAVENIMIDLYNLYFDWYVVYHQFHIYSTNVENSAILLDQITRKYKAGLSDRSDLSRIKIMNIEYKKARDMYYTQYQSMTGKVNKWQKGVNKIPTDLNIRPEEKISLPDINSSGFSISNTRQMKILDLSKELLFYTLKKNKNELLPELNFIFSYKKSRNIFEKSTYSTQMGLKDSSLNNYVVGLELSYPLGSHLARGRVDEAKSDLKKWDHELKNFQLNYTQGYEEVVKILNIYLNILEYDRDLMKQAEILLSEEEKKYRQGRSDFYYIIENKNSLLKYNLIYIQDYIAYKKYHIQMLGLMDKIK